jgi:hypothetical protein
MKRNMLMIALALAAMSASQAAMESSRNPALREAMRPGAEAAREEAMRQVANARSCDVCRMTAKMQLAAARHELVEEFKVDLAACLNMTNWWEQAQGVAEAAMNFYEGGVLIREQYAARLDLCDLLGGGPYDPVIDPDDFVAVIDNPHLPFPVGARWVYESETEDGLETIEVTVLEETREIMGVECVTVRDTVSVEGELLEDTYDWYAQDVHGNVWYFGEITFNFEDGFIADIDGTWLAGVDGAKPGIVMLGAPSPGVTYRQEWLLGEAEDAATVLDVHAAVTIGFGTFTECVKTADFLPPEPDALEHKYYAPGIGFIYETKDGSDETVELVEYSGL